VSWLLLSVTANDWQRPEFIVSVASLAGGAGGIIIGLATQQLLTNAFMGLSLVSATQYWQLA